MDEIIQNSERIIFIIEEKGWNLYDITDIPTDKAFTWDEISQKQPVKHLIKDHMYVFTPIQEAGLSLRETYKKTMGLGPAMHFDIAESGWIGAKIKQKVNNKVIALFTRICSEDNFIIITSPPTVVDMEPDILICNAENAVRLFESYFHIVFPEDFGISSPVPIPPIFN